MPPITPQNMKMETFVENRCHEIWTIMEYIKTEFEPNHIQFAHVPTDENPADHITRGATSEEELRKTNWFHGPVWLSEDAYSNHPDKKSIFKLIVDVNYDDNRFSENSEPRRTKPGNLSQELRDNHLALMANDVSTLSE